MQSEGERRYLLGERSTSSSGNTKAAAMSIKGWEKGNIEVQSRPDGSDVGSSQQSSSNDPEVKVPWWAYIWDYEPGRSKEESAFVQRLDVSVLIILSLGYFIKNLDQTNIS